MKKIIAIALLANAALLGVFLLKEFSSVEAGADDPVVATENGDTNGDGNRDIGDAVYLLDWLFQGGPEPVPCTDLDLAAQLEAAQAELAACQGPCATAEGRYIDNGDGTVTDCQTGLMWQKTVAPQLMDPWRAERYCETLQLGGRFGWRLPLSRDLARMDRDAAGGFPFEGGVGDFHWSENLQAVVDDVVLQIYIRFGDGQIHFAELEDERLSVRAVRTIEPGE